MNFPAISSRCAAEPRRSAGFGNEASMSSAARHVLQEALIYFFDDLKAVFGPGGSTPAIAERSEAKRAAPQGFAGEVRLKADARGHFMFPAEVNGRAADFIAGATLVVLTYEDAARLGLSPQRLHFSGRAQTANGTARVAPVMDRVRVEDITIRNVPWSPRRGRSPPTCSAS
jgi:clan AA aspartic protease (TIGR02281 family)